ncbi:glycosyltransferase family 2 protein [Actinomyces sp. B33]|uniref:glycosyltransferase family 2 protein n=1 Tax=Actinomyces sp. B33 TaxID=2942131 RepID=UPI0023423DF0|nr:glycosyltransferase family 2 protein [Actinomyces sp. B33]MDC4232647.1 glycosyltransferase family 2 protein [Actinomyces sp. B33]
MPRVLVIIPAWNEEEVLAGVLREVLTSVQGVADVLVVSDGSTDRTARIARDAGVAVLDLPLNLGVGGAMRAGYLYAARHDYDYAVQLDADGQHDPAEIPALLDRSRSEGADLVIGARFAGKGDYSVRGPRHWAMKVLSVILSRVCGTRLTDTTSGFKLCTRRAIGLFSRDYPAEYLGDTIEALVLASRRGLVIRQEPVEMRPRAGGEPSHDPLKAAVFLIRAFLALGVALSRPRVPSPVPPAEEASR